MLNKEIFKLGLKELFTAHYSLESVNREMLEYWYSECETLEDDDFLFAIQRAKYSKNQPRLYDILTGLKHYNGDKTIKEYTTRLKREEENKKHKESGEIYSEEFIKMMEEF